MNNGCLTINRVLAALAIALLLTAVIAPDWSGRAPGDSTSYGPNGPVEMRCIEGYRFAISGSRSSPTQVLDEHGRGIRCNLASQ